METKKRGIVIAPEMIITGEKSMEITNLVVDSTQLRRYLLYWDMADFPENIISNASSPEIEYLKEVGFLKRSKNMTIESGDVVNLFLKNQYRAFKQNNEFEPGSWSLAQPNSKLILSSDSSEISRNLEVELYNSLPVPTNENSLDDILIFKERRNEELLEFRHLMDNLYLEIINSGDEQRAKIKSIDLLKLKINEIDRVMEESKIKRLLGSVKVEFNLKDIVAKTGLGVLGSVIGDYPVEFGLFGGAALSLISVKSEMSLKPKELPSDLKDYAYLYYSTKEL